MRWQLTRRRVGLTVAAVVALTAGGVGGAVAVAGDDDDHDRPIPAAELERAKRAALAETGGGTVTETEVGDEESMYEVEVTLDDGRQVDVQLDADLEVVGSETDGTTDD